jgi:hypothetical protein
VLIFAGKTGKLKKVIFSTAYLPPLDYMTALYAADAVALEIHETYPRQTWRNRCRIATANGLLDLSIPVEKPQGNHTLTRDVVISQKHNWQHIHWRAIRSAYSKSPFFMYYQDLLEPFYRNPPPQHLLQWNQDLLQAIAGVLQPLPPMKVTEIYHKQPEGATDLRNAFSPKTHRQLTSLAAHLPSYYQVFDEKFGFQPNLSVADLLFNLGPDAGPALLNWSRNISL